MAKIIVLLVGVLFAGFMRVGITVCSVSKHHKNFNVFSPMLNLYLASTHSYWIFSYLHDSTFSLE